MHYGSFESCNFEMFLVDFNVFCASTPMFTPLYTSLSFVEIVGSCVDPGKWP